MSILLVPPSTIKQAPSLLSAAIEYATRGWSIIPTIAKKSAHLWKQFQTAPADEECLRRMFNRSDITGLAVILGSASGGLACRDFDEEEAYQRWAADHPDLATLLPTVRTSRGFHVYFQGPEGFQNLGDGEYRADSSHYCLLPPSQHPSGSVYTWIVPLPLAELPHVDPVRAGLLTQEIQDIQETQDTQDTHCMGKQGEVPTFLAETLPTCQGQRNRKLFELARRLKAIMPNASIPDLKPIVRQWFDLALPVIGTKDWSISWEDFVTAWQAVKQPFGGRWAEIVQAAYSMNVDTGDHDGAAAGIIRLCAALQAHHGEGVPFPLSCKRAAGAVGVSKPRAGKVLKMLAAEGIIERVKPGGAKGSKQAAEYRFCGG